MRALTSCHKLSWTLSKSLFPSGPQFPQLLNKAEMGEKMSGLSEGLPQRRFPGNAGWKLRRGRLTDIFVKTDINRDKTDRYMRIRWPP